MCYLLLLLISYFNWFVIADDNEILPSLDAHAAEVDLVASYNKVDNGGLAALELDGSVVGEDIVMSVNGNLDVLEVGHWDDNALIALGISFYSRCHRGKSNVGGIARGSDRLGKITNK